MQYTVVVTVDTWESEHGYWLARAAKFALTQSALTKEKALELVLDSVRTYLGYAAEHGQLETVLRYATPGPAGTHKRARPIARCRSSAAGKLR